MSDEYVDIGISDEELGRRFREALHEASEESVSIFYVIDRDHEIQYSVRVEEVLI